PEVELCVVGDDDQAIFQWRGSDVANIVGFGRRYHGVVRFSITTNRRSRPYIIERANRFAASIPARLDKAMHPHRPSVGAPEITVWYAPSELDEAGWIAQLILDLNDVGVPFRDIAVLVRTSAAYPKLVSQFATFDVPVQPGGRTGLFEQREAVLLGRAVAWLTDLDWRSGFGQGAPVTEGDLLGEFERVFALDGARRSRVAVFLRQWREAVPRQNRQADLVGELYGLLGELGVRAWNLGDQRVVNRLGTLARFSALL